MFGLIVSSRLIKFPQQVSDTKFVWIVENARSINHLAIFLTGTKPFPQDCGGSIYVNFSNQPSQWTHLGFISNNKPSSIFQLSGLHDHGAPKNEMIDEEEITLQIGLSLESLQEIERKVESQSSEKEREKEKQAITKFIQENTTPTVPTQNDYVTFIHKMMENFFNYAVGFVKTIPTGLIEGNQRNFQEPNINMQQQTTSVIPTHVLEGWYNKFKTKISINPFFWKD